ncbi:MAG TPA: nitronate monooxygenase [Dehalococcoidia bacterium]|nr:nitronate monooxygenase [Dehalococcoidia bacterium]
MKTRITELLGIKYPIIQSGMGLVADSTLVIGTCNAGGLGILSAWSSTPEGLRKTIREIRQSVGDKTFGVNLVPFQPGYKKYLDVMLEERVPMLNSGLRDPFSLVGMKKPGNVIYIATVGNVRQAVRVEKAGADAVIVQGLEAGGHAGKIASVVLIPEVVKVVKIPVIAAGGFCDGKGLAAALALGAEGIAMGTRFAVTQESPLPPQLKSKYLEARDNDAVLSTVWDGLDMRAIPGQKIKRYHGWWTRFWEIIPTFLYMKKAYNASLRELMGTARLVRQVHAPPIQFMVGMEMFRRGVENGELDRSILIAGQVVGRVEDIPTCHQLIERTVAEAEQVLKDLHSKLALL